MTHTEKLEMLGFKKAANSIKELKALRVRMAIAYEHFRYVKPEKINAFNEKLKKEGVTKTGKAGVNMHHHYKQLVFIKLEEYTEAPPMGVLDDLEAAQALGCFDYYEIAKIKAIVEDKDPIVFGRINKCPDRFFIAQWDDDVNINQILSENEG